MSLKKPVQKKQKTMGASPSSPLSGKNYITPSSETTVFETPLEILEEIFHNLPGVEVVRHCRLVCKQWKEVVDSESLWRERCRREGYMPRNSSVDIKCWQKFYFLCKKRKNLLKNPIAKESFKFWKIVSNGGDRWKIEKSRVPHPVKGVKKDFVTSYSACLKSQLIDLELEGYHPEFMDHCQPAIKISDWYAARFDCACQYTIKVELLNAQKNCIQTFEPEPVVIEQWNDQAWHQMTHVFKNYGSGIRYIHFVHGGQDGQYWAGWYGVRVTNSSVEICPDID